MSLTLHRSPRVDLLAEALAARLADPLDDPFASELVIVPAKGVERWLSQRLSHRLGASGGDDGAAANIEFRAPRSLVAEVVAGGPAGTAGVDPWHPDALVWPLLRVIDASMGEPWSAVLTRHLGRSGEHGDEHRRGRRWAVAHRLARLFASYAAQRPTMLLAWEGGTDDDGAGAPVEPDLTWQPELWRRLVDHVKEPSPGERHREAVQRLRADPVTASLPSRLSLFGHTRLTTSEVEVLHAVGAHRQVDVWLPHPSDVLWQALRDPSSVGAVPRTGDDSHLAAQHPLLATLGRDVRELQRTVAPVAATSVTLDVPRDRPATLLGRLQADIEANRAPAGDHRLDPADRSVQVHACHGAARQVEVLREVVLGLLADDPTLEPRDVIVMCPDIERFAPLIEAAFGLGGLDPASSAGWHPGQQLQVRLADRSLVQTNPVLAVVDRLIDLAGGRATANEVLDLAAADPVRRRFGFTDDDLATLARWVGDTGVRWAFDAEHRRPYGLDGYLQNTWRFGLDRVLAGIAVSDDARRYFGVTLPYDAVGSSDIDLAGRFAELVDRVRSVVDRLGGEPDSDGQWSVREWVDLLHDAVGAVTAVGWGDEWQVHQAERELAAIAAEQADATVRLTLPDVRSLLGARLQGRPTRANFRTGSLTVCTMVPMRSVPHRVVCLLGLDDGVFPRAGAPDGDDVLARRPLTGERDPRSEDRQLLLDAVLAATDHLVVTYAGAHEVTGHPRPAAVPLGELLDAVRDTLATTGRDTVAGDDLGHVLVEHPLQTFDARNFTPGRLGRDGAFSFDAAARSAAVAARSPRVPRLRMDALDLVPWLAADVELAALAAFVRMPVKEFCRRRLGLAVWDDDSVLDDALPLELDGLQRWSVASAMLDDRLAGLDLDQALAMAWRRGDLPPGRSGWTVAQGVAASVEPIAERALDVMGGEAPTTVDVDVDLGDGRRLRGTVAGVHGDRAVQVSCSRFGPRHHLDAWLPLLALSAGAPGRPWTSGVVVRHRDGAGLVAFNPIDPEVARAHLRDLVALRDLGLTAPLRLPLKTGFVVAQTLRRVAGRQPDQVVDRMVADAARREWDDRWTKQGQLIAGENARDLHPAVWGAGASVDVLLDAPAGHSVAALADRLWRPVLDLGWDDAS